jgi:hypothetical protein
MDKLYGKSDKLKYLGPTATKSCVRDEIKVRINPEMHIVIYLTIFHLLSKHKIHEL